MLRVNEYDLLLLDLGLPLMDGMGSSQPSAGARQRLAGDYSYRSRPFRGPGEWT